MSQNDHIISYLLPPGRTIDPLKALRLFKCWSLSSRISDLRKRGYKIKSELVTNKKTGKYYAKYFLA